MFSSTSFPHLWILFWMAQLLYSSIFCNLVSFPSLPHSLHLSFIFSYASHLASCLNDFHPIPFLSLRFHIFISSVFIFLNHFNIFALLSVGVSDKIRNMHKRLLDVKKCEKFKSYKYFWEELSLTQSNFFPFISLSCFFSRLLFNIYSVIVSPSSYCHLSLFLFPPSLHCHPPC